MGPKVEAISISFPKSWRTGVLIRVRTNCVTMLLLQYVDWPLVMFWQGFSKVCCSVTVGQHLIKTALMILKLLFRYRCNWHSYKTPDPLHTRVDGRTKLFWTQSKVDSLQNAELSIPSFPCANAKPQRWINHSIFPLSLNRLGKCDKTRKNRKVVYCRDGILTATTMWNKDSSTCLKA